MRLNLFILFVLSSINAFSQSKFEGILYGQKDKPLPEGIQVMKSEADGKLYAINEILILF